ncbi:MAG TPA: DinB family protein [Thermoanaerobaculia bacterium]|nr:DinB family protein [Thermoanaerobaculia bacterium]
MEAASAEARALAKEPRREWFGVRPTPHTWSAADCIRHLTSANERYNKKFDELISSAPPAKDGRSLYRHSLMGRVLLWAMEPPIRKKFRSPRSFLPQEDERTPEELLSAFEESQRVFVALIPRCEGLDFSKVRPRYPASKFIKMNFWDALTLIAAHERRHLWQARRAIESAAALRRSSAASIE